MALVLILVETSTKRAVGSIDDDLSTDGSLAASLVQRQRLLGVPDAEIVDSLRGWSNGYVVATTYAG